MFNRPQEGAHPNLTLEFPVPEENSEAVMSGAKDHTEHMFPRAAVFYPEGLLYAELDDFSAMAPPSPPSTLSTGSTSGTFPNRIHDNSSINREPGSYTQVREQPDRPPPEDPQPPKLRETELNHRLSSLCLTLSGRLQKCQNDGTAQLEQDLPWNPEVFGSALDDTAEFLNIIRSCQLGAVGKMNSTETSTSGLGIVITLNLLSAYIQMVTIFDRLLRSLRTQLGSEMDLLHGDGRGPQALPNLQLAGFAVQQGGLQARILLATMLHQFNSMGRLLGLPAEFRVMGSLRGEREMQVGRDRISGLWENHDGARIMMATMRGSGSCGLAALRSLREIISEVNMLLDGD
ncbi:hypothetical protein MMYC01_201686 [Madurella mycetomatis]|uniref:Uncharacterized protein n=1 Tax=Madurella mycetomatis TaxID=100816 RepID=A0A175WEH7_9PEZI|nr:hypothetical protein MMYC01_201686 [Madurella mycetomatis]